ncbi:FAD-dependent oxidoreductase [Amycolatopsis sp. OK19-0408]|uniref:FAD-dependent oxidoreductase n=1 Tax=Amycolatopsis iheyensis TaxID=2945988 RepID=A0A9X2NDR1_9PSEU|nr:FAD-dependent oxidoreductase [Amycolatopsis iheyensis]MCR6485000.1 FAD-dependent oxidoreductase [Amycolatopsis iheyensis]
MSETTEVVVIGGGYAGVMAANRLTGRADVRVTLVNPRPHFVERIRLHQLVGGSDDAVVAYQDVLAGRVRLVVDSVTGIDTAARTVTLASGATAGYDYLVYAVGSHSASTPEHAYPVTSFEEARRLRPVVEAATAVTVVGAGPAGIETAAELAEAGHDVTLVCGGQLGPYLHPAGRRAVASRLAALGVRMLVDAVVREVTRDAVRLTDGRELPSPVTIWTAGFGVPDLARRSGLSTDETGRLRTDETLTSVDDDRVLAAGDAAAPSGLPYRMGCQSAVQLGPQAAETVLSRLDGRPPSPVEVGFAGQCLSLGRRAGIFQFSHRDDTAIRLHLGGRLGAKVKEWVCRSTVWQLKYESRKPGVRKWWAKDARRRDRLAAQPAAV